MIILLSEFQFFCSSGLLVITMKWDAKYGFHIAAMLFYNPQKN